MYIWSQKYSKYICNLCACLKRYKHIFLIFDMFTNIYIYIYIYIQRLFYLFTNIYRLKNKGKFAKTNPQLYFNPKPILKLESNGKLT